MGQQIKLRPQTKIFHLYNGFNGYYGTTAAMASMALTNPLALDSVNATNGSSISPAYLINSTSMPVQSLPVTGRAGLFKNVEHCS